MRYELFDFQKKAVDELLSKMQRMQRRYHEDHELSSVLLTAPTGAGKTVISAAVAEGLFVGNDITSDDPHAVILWLSDNPPLNEQTKHRFAVSADALNERTDMIIIDETFAISNRKMQPHHIYFLNRQKLSTRAKLANSSEGGRTFYDVLTDTIEDEDINLYLMIDEAHLGIGTGDNKGTTENENKTIYAKLIDGQSGINPPMPVVIGITATPTRFQNAMQGRANRNTMSPVVVKNESVRNAGIIKDTIELRSPKSSQKALNQDLRQACAKLAEMSAHWNAYCLHNEAEPVIPLLVVQTEDKVTDESLENMCKEIRQVLTEIDTDVFANCFGEHEDRDNAYAKIPYISPDSLQDHTEIKILFAKDAISTGWDCPRAEVLYSRRKRSDKDYIHQMLGRMIRTPLARRIDSDEVLNTVACYLPEYDETSVKDVADLIKNDNDLGSTTNVTANPVVAGWYSETKQTLQSILDVADDEKKAEHVVTAIGNVSELPEGVELHNTLFDVDYNADGKTSNSNTHSANNVEQNFDTSSKPSNLQRPEPRKSRVVINKPVIEQAVSNMPATRDANEDAALKESFEGIVSRHSQQTDIDKFILLFSAINILTGITDPAGNPWENDLLLQEDFCNKIDAAIVAHPMQFEQSLRDISYRKQVVVKVDVLGNKIIDDGAPAEEIEIDEARVISIYQEVVRKFGNSDYVKAYCKKHNPEERAEVDREVIKRLGAVISCMEVFTELEHWADSKAHELIEKHKPNKGRMNEDQLQKWDNEVEGRANPWVERNLSVPTRVLNQSEVYKAYRKHVITSQKDGLAHLQLSIMEDRIVEKEIADSYNVAWYRNTPKNLNCSLSIPWISGSKPNGDLIYENMYPDFIFFEKNNNDQITRNIIDPHGDWLGDSIPKLKGYIEYLRDHGNDFAKVLAVADTPKEYRYLDLKDPAVVKAILDNTDGNAKTLFENQDISHTYMRIE
jgi:DNA or RNA helicases of superfamily II